VISEHLHRRDLFSISTYQKRKVLLETLISLWIMFLVRKSPKYRERKKKEWEIIIREMRIKFS